MKKKQWKKLLIREMRKTNENKSIKINHNKINHYKIQRNNNNNSNMGFLLKYLMIQKMMNQTLNICKDQDKKDNL